MKTQTYYIRCDIDKELTVAHLSDLHGKKCNTLLCEVKAAEPDIIAITGDFTKDYSASDKATLEILEELSKTAPTFYSLGNHERGITKEDVRKISETGVIILDNCYTEVLGIKIGGLTSGFITSNTGNGRDNPHLFASPEPNCGWLEDFEKETGFKLLLCHHPEYYATHLKNRKIDLVLSGHAHGGQIRLFGSGLIAPGQGFFPKYTSGVHDNRLIISRGLANTAKLIPRLFNEPELVVVRVGFKEKP